MSAHDNTMQKAIAAIMAGDSTTEEKAQVIFKLMNTPSKPDDVAKPDDATPKQEETQETRDEVTVCGVTLGVDATELNLFNRRIKEVTAADVAAVARLTRLRVVYLNRNDLTSVPPELFAHNRALKSVRLDNNQLTAVPADLFAHNRALTHASLVTTKLTSLPAQLFAYNLALKELCFGCNEGLKRVPIAWYRHWTAWSDYSQKHCGRQDVAHFVAAHPEVLDLPLEVPVPGHST